PRDFIDYNRFANESTENYSSSFFMNNPLIVQNAIDRPGGAGAAVVWSVPTLPLTVRALYVAADADRPTADLLTEGGLFGDRNQGSLEVQYDFSRALTARLQYTTATVNNTDISAIGFNAEWAITRYVGVFGRVAFGSYEGTNSVLNRRLDLSPWTWAVGATVRNLVIPGSTAGVAVGQPFVEDDFGTANQTNFEGFFTFLLNDNISFTPAILVVRNPNNDRSNGTIWQWLVRMVFSF
ncbi:carbohydrate porin, partial [Leptolyngbya sp. FACHB-36]|uniref:carbohydrate porin n=1 Tax=Leptolyngbya sp. FACHB-36 TaxID=2692808 RepID=UPI0016816E3A